MKRFLILPLLALGTLGQSSITDNNLARKANVLAVETLTYSGTTVTIPAGKGPLQLSQLTCTNNATLAWSSLASGDGGKVLVNPAATNCTFTLPSYAFGPAGKSLTITGGTGNTNYTEIGWVNNVVDGTNRVTVNALNYY